jgi:hypothetical protein
MKRIVILFLLAVLIGGCQSSPRPSLRVMDNITFMSLWNTYQHCATSENLDELRADVRELAGITQLRTSDVDFLVPLPKVIRRHVSAQPIRTAADPKAMVAACSLHAADVALERGKQDIATELLTDLLDTHSSGEYAYYVQEAKVTLLRIQPSAVLISEPGSTFAPSRQSRSPLGRTATSQKNASSAALDSAQYE